MNTARQSIIKLPQMQVIAERFKDSVVWEDSLIGCVVNELASGNPAPYHQANIRLSASDFSRLLAGYVWHVITKRVADGKQCDELAIAQDVANLQKDGDYEHILNYLYSTVASGANVAMVQMYVDEILANASMVRLLAVGDDIKTIVTDKQLTVEDKIAEVTARVTQVALNYANRPDESMQGLVNQFESNFAERLANGKDRALTTGFSGWDAIGGIDAGEVIVIAGKAGLGKTTLSLDLALHMAGLCADAEHVEYFSLEMDAESMLAKIMHKLTGVPARRIKNPSTMIKADIQKFYDGLQTMNNLKINMRYRPGLSPARLRSDLYRARLEHGVKAVIIDGLWLMSPDVSLKEFNQQGTTRLSITTDKNDLLHTGLTMPLMDIAREFEVPLIILHQYNQDNKNRADARPVLTDMKGGMAVQQDVDTIWGLYRPDDSITTELHGLKGRNNAMIQGHVVPMHYDYTHDSYRGA